MKNLIITLILITVIPGCKKEIEGCTRSNAANYNPKATIDDGSCIQYGCVTATKGPIHNIYLECITLEEYEEKQRNQTYDKDGYENNSFRFVKDCNEC